MKTVALFAVAFVIIAPLLLLILAFLTGRVNRSYPVMDGTLEVEINGEKGALQSFAEKYQPVMYKQPEIVTPPILWVWWNAVDRGDKIDFIYYNVWENEINPNPTVHSYYSFFRSFYYGYPLYDIEYIQVTISKLTGQVDGIRFETGPSDNFHSLFNEHIVLKASHVGGIDYAVKLINRDTRNEIKSFAAQPKFDGSHISLGVQTWNHLSNLLVASNESIYLERVPAGQLKQLSDDEYASYKFVRKSQGDHVTTEDPISRVVSIVAVFVFVTAMATLFARFKKR